MVMVCPQSSEPESNGEVPDKPRSERLLDGRTWDQMADAR